MGILGKFSMRNGLKKAKNHEDAQIVFAGYFLFTKASTDWL
jgi:hypothetical protein